MDTPNNPRSSSESDYREVYEVAILERLRNNITAYSRVQQKKSGRKHLAPRLRGDDLGVVATSVTQDVGVTPETLADIDERLDPNGDAFDFRFWASMFLQLLKDDGIKRANSNVTFRNLSVTGSPQALSLQPNILSPFLTLARLPMALAGRKTTERKVILHDMNGVLEKGEMLLVLGRPGSGCTSFLRAITGHIAGLTKTVDTSIKYEGVDQDSFLRTRRGRAVFNHENDEHLPHLTVGQTLEFAAKAETPQARLAGVDRPTHVKHMVNVILRIFGLSHVRHTKVGNDTIRGVSGGQRKRVSIAEMALTRSSLAAWDNSTRGLDSATALDFVQHLRTLSDMIGITQAVAIYQSSQAMYNLFDKVTVLYDGRQIYYGPVDTARAYFTDMGWYCSPRMTTPDFLTSVTNADERRCREDVIGDVPQTAHDFERYWQQSDQYKLALGQLTEAEKSDDPSAHLDSVRAAHRQAQAHHTRQNSPYLISVPMQMRLCMKRSMQLLWNDKGSTVALALGRVVLALIVGSIYSNPPNTTSSLQSRGSVIFLATLMNALMAVVEVGALFSKRDVVLKQKNYGFYHPAADALAAYMVDIPVKFVISTLFNVVFYFLAGLRAEASNFFVFLLFNFLGTLLMSAVFRTIGAATKQLAQAYAICGIGILVMIMYTGFALQTTYMHPWFRWINYLNPIAYIFEALLVNEVHGRQIPCAPTSLIPPYPGATSFACAFIGAQPNSATVSGDAWVEGSYGYSYSHIWRNLGIGLAYMVVFLAAYLFAIETRAAAQVQAQRLIFRSRNAALQANIGADIESRPSSEKAGIVVREKEASLSSTKRLDGGTLMWQDLNLEINYQGKSRLLLDGVSGWVAPGKLTCLMGVSGAGKTTLLDTLAQRHNTTGRISGAILMNGAPLMPAFQRKTGYVQQADLHMGTSTVREALQFSALLRQPSRVSKADKVAYVETVIQMLNMHAFGDSIIGRPGEGLNIEQRKLLTIGVELAAKPEILFLDEPTSGLDSQSSWTIVSLLRKLANNGQAVLATIHQPSALIFEQFDELLLLAKGGQTSYFGALGQNCTTLTGYLENHGARKCTADENPAEYMLANINDTTQDWPETWRSSSEREAILDSLRSMSPTVVPNEDDKLTHALNFRSQLYHVLRRTCQNYWRSPAYVYAKLQFSIAAGLFIGFTFFLQDTSITGMQNMIFGIYMLNSTFSTVVNQVMSRFLPQRALFEMRESPSRMYSWLVFVLSHVIVEIPLQIILGVVVWACWYFPIFGAGQSSSSQGLMLVFTVQFMVFASTWAQMLIFCLPSLETAGSLSTILFTMTLQFNGVLQPPSALPGFWIFMYRVSPFTYLVGGFAGVGLEGRPVSCAQNELAVFDPPQGQICGEYLSTYLERGAPGALLNPQATAGCEYCPLRNANEFLANSWIYPSDKYRNLGVLFVYIVFNIGVAVVAYYLFRVKTLSTGGLLRRRIKSKKVEPAIERRQRQRPGASFWTHVSLYYKFAVALLTTWYATWLGHGYGA